MHADMSDMEAAFALAEAHPDVFRGEPGAERDPRRDPQPGDVLAVGSDVREVLERFSGRIEYGFPRRAASRWLSLMQWQRWARNADVRKVAP